MNETVKGGYRVITPKVPPDPVGGLWGTSVPQGNYERNYRAEHAAHSAKVEAIIEWVRDNGALIDQTPSAKVTINVKGQQVKGDITIYPDSKV